MNTKLTCFGTDRTLSKGRGESAQRRSRRTFAGVLAFIAALSAVIAPATKAACVAAPRKTSLHSIAFFYGDPVPVERLARFDAVVVEPDSSFDPLAHADAGPAWYAYVSVGEVRADRAYYASIPKRWIVGHNNAWNANVIDQSAPGWPRFLVERIVEPLWQRGYRGFFLDTLDSYQLVAKTDAERAGQQAGLVAAIGAIKTRFPEARLILNRGFDILPRVHDDVSAVAFESLFGQWDQSNRRYGAVPAGDRDWLLAQASTIRVRYDLPVVSIDYCSPTDDRCRREIAHKICDLGIVPYVTDGALQTVGRGPGR